MEFKPLIIILLLFTITRLAGQNVVNPSSGSIQQDMSSDELAADSAKGKWRTGLSVVQQFNYPILHSIIEVELAKQNHRIYAGPCYTLLLENYFGDEILGGQYDKNAYGINFGYRYMSGTKWKRISVVLQTDFSIYRVRYQHWGGHGAGVQEKKPVIVENNGGIGLNYQISPNLAVSVGFGLGSPAGFFLMLDRVNPHSWLGFYYSIR